MTGNPSASYLKHLQNKGNGFYQQPQPVHRCILHRMKKEIMQWQSFLAKSNLEVIPFLRRTPADCQDLEAIV